MEFLGDGDCADAMLLIVDSVCHRLRLWGRSCK